MNKIKVKVYKDPNGEGAYINKTAKFLEKVLPKAKMGMQVTEDDILNETLEQLTLTQNAEDIAMHLEDTFGISNDMALDYVDLVVSKIYRDDVSQTKEEMLSQDPNIIEPLVKKEKLYDLNSTWESDNMNEDWDQEEIEDEETEEAEEEAEETEDAGLPTEKKGGTVSKKKFVKNIVTGLKKAAEGMQQQQANEPTILDTPIKGRSSFIGQFRRGVKDLGNEFYAKKIYDQTQELNNQVRSLPPMAQDGMEVEGQDNENISHHLEKYANAVGNIFKQPMNQIHGAGFENLPEARKGREQRQAERQQRNMSKDFKSMFGDVAAGYFGVPGMPNYIQVISPQVNTQQPSQQSNQPYTGPFVDVEYKKGPWWSGKREWSAKGIPAQMLMGMSGGRGVMPGYGYMPGGYNYGASWSTQRTFPGEIIRTKSSSINAAADPSKTNTTVNSSASSSISPGSTSSSTSSSTTAINNNPANNSTADNVAENTSGKSTPGAVLIYPGATDTYLIQMSDGALIQKIGNPRDPKPDDPVKGRYNPEQAKGILPKLTSPNPMRKDWMFSGASSLMPDASGDFINPAKTKAYVELRDKVFHGDPLRDIEGNPKYWWDNDYVKRSGLKDIPGTSVMEDKIWSSPTSKEDFNKAWDKWNDLYDNKGEAESDKFYNENKNLLGSDSYITVDDQGNEYSTNINMAYLPPDLQEQMNNYDNIPGTINFDWLKQNSNILYKPYAYGGNVSGPMPDEYGNLQKFIYGGGDDVSPIVAYEDNYINSKNVDDPFMFRNGGLYKFDGENNSQVEPQWTVSNPPAPSGVNQYQTPAFNRDNPNATATSNFAAYNEMKKRGLVQGTYDPTKSYDMSNMQNQNKTTTTTTNTQNQTYTGYNTRGGYPTAPSPWEQILGKFLPYKKDFKWLSQKDYPRTADGQIYNPNTQTVQQGPSQTQTQTQQGQPGTQGQPGSLPAGYYYDMTSTKKGPFWKREHTLSLKGKWYDPNNPNANTAAGSGNTQSNQFNNGKGPTLDAAGPGTSNFTESADGKSAMSYTVADNNRTGQPNATNAKDYYGYTDDYWNSLSRRQKKWEKNSMRTEQEYDLEKEINSNQANTQTGPTNTSSTTPTPQIQPQPNQGIGADRFVSEKEEMTNAPGFAYGGYVPEYMAYGGYMPAYQGGGANAGTGPFDPNDTGIAGGGIGPCTEEQVLKAGPGDPCYNSNYSKGTPKDFSVDYDVEQAGTLQLGNIANLGQLTGEGAQMISGINEDLYNKDFMYDNIADSLNRQPTSYTPIRGGYLQSGRIGSKGQGRGSTGFKSVVGTDAFTKEGGELKFRQGGVYDLTQEEIGQILAAGGQIKFIK